MWGFSILKIVTAAACHKPGSRRKAEQTESGVSVRQYLPTAFHHPGVAFCRGHNRVPQMGWGPGECRSNVSEASMKMVQRINSMLNAAFNYSLRDYFYSFLALSLEAQPCVCYRFYGLENHRISQSISLS